MVHFLAYFSCLPFFCSSCLDCAPFWHGSYFSIQDLCCTGFCFLDPIPFSLAYHSLTLLVLTLECFLKEHRIECWISEIIFGLPSCLVGSLTGLRIAGWLSILKNFEICLTLLFHCCCRKISPILMLIWIWLFSFLEKSQDLYLNVRFIYYLP